MSEGDGDRLADEADDLEAAQAAAPDEDDDEAALGGRILPPPSDEQPIVLDDSDESDHWRARRPLEAYDPVASLPLVAPDVPLPEPELPDREPDAEAEGEGSLSRAWTRLEIRTPLDELDAFAAGRIEALARLGQADRAALARDAAELARAALRQAMGASPREAAP